MSNQLPYTHLQDQSEKGLLQILIDKICCLSDNITNLNNNEYKLAIFQQINAATGTVTAPTGATILTNQISGGRDAFVSTIDTGQPTGNFPSTSLSIPVDVASFDNSGNFTLSGTPSAYPVALIYWIKIKAQDLINVTIDNIIEDSIWYNIAPNQSTIVCTPYDAIALSSTEITNVSGSNTFEGSGIAQRRTVVMATSGIISNMNVVTSSSQPVSGALTITLFKNGLTTGLAVVIAAGSPSGVTPHTNTTNYVSFSAGDYLYWSATNAATATSAIVGSISAKITEIK